MSLLWNFVNEELRRSCMLWSTFIRLVLCIREAPWILCRPFRGLVVHRYFYPTPYGVGSVIPLLAGLDLLVPSSIELLGRRIGQSEPTYPIKRKTKKPRARKADRGDGASPHHPQNQNRTCWDPGAEHCLYDPICLIFDLVFGSSPFQK